MLTPSCRFKTLTDIFEGLKLQAGAGVIPACAEILHHHWRRAWETTCTCCKVKFLLRGAELTCSWWSPLYSSLCTLQVGKDAVIVEADAIKSKDVVYQQLRLRMAADSSLDAYVHEYSTAAAELMLVTAINQQKVSALAGLQYKTAASCAGNGGPSPEGKRRFSIAIGSHW